ncbi:MAG: leucyl/phenylalanyl-tRNA--protein transferase [Chloroflexales bacterium]|nr:leucyl/phenylalanyl-tRNA--protein transferase [Chloroflexales bacterium]
MTVKITPQLLLQAYSTGHFPMDDHGRIAWYNPDPRGIIPIDEHFHVPARLARTYRSQRYTITSDHAFGAVMQACAVPRIESPGSWISPEFVAVYSQLHQLGYAHSVETWYKGELVGGLYGVALGGLFAGESMFSLARDASKVALIALVERLRLGNFAILDTQWVTPHLAQFGAFWMPQVHYLRLLPQVIQRRTEWVRDL